jgi:L-aspartate oxidase
MADLGADVLVIGSGIAGLSFALKAAAVGRVMLVTKKTRAESNTNYAQGGIAAVMDPNDSFELHVKDTLRAGAGLCDRRIVERLALEGPDRVRDLMEWGVNFTRAGDTLSLGREGGHSRRRILHASDLTGREIERALLDAVAEHPNIELLEDHQAVDLRVGTSRAHDGDRCVGALILDHRNRRLYSIDASIVLLASGGLAHAYRFTTNPAIATGDGVAMAYRAGALVANLEFVQFHPTAFYPAGDSALLISEAVRGEGALLTGRDGSILYDGAAPLDPLSPRDVVARSIDRHLKERGEEHVWLDLSPIGTRRIEERFPGILEACAARGVDIRKEPVPVVPAAHYACGGILTDEDGRSSLPGLFAVGEAACTGVHGANRLASNSLLEAVVYSHRAAAILPLELAEAANDAASATDSCDRVLATPPSADLALAATLRTELRTVMWEDAGIVRSDEGLARAEAALLELQLRFVSGIAEPAADPDLVEVRNLCEVGLLIVRSARMRPESRGLHYNVDHPYRDNERCLRATVLGT